MTVVVVLATIIALMFENVDKTKATLIGAVIAIIIFKYMLPWEESFKEIFNPERHPHFSELLVSFVNVEAVIIIFSISIIVALTKKAGFFDWVSLSLIRLTKGNPIAIFLVLGGTSFLVSMFFDNVSAIILLGSLTVVIANEIDAEPRPFLLFVALNTIIGGLPTPVSSLPNIIYYSRYQVISFVDFMLYVLPIAILFYCLSAAYFLIVYKKEIRVRIPEEKKNQFARINPWAGIENRNNIIKSGVLLVFLFGGFMIASSIHLTVDIVALIVVGLGLLIFKVNLKQFVERHVEWNTLVFFISLFVLMGILNESGVMNPITTLLNNVAKNSANEKVGLIAVAIIIGTIGYLLTGFINVVPAAVIFSNIFQTLEKVSVGLWLSFVLTGNLAGSLTPLGSVTILMAIEIMRKEKIKCSFIDYIKRTLPVSLMLQLVALGYSAILIAVL